MGIAVDADLERLVERCRRGDSAAWSTLVDRFQSLVYSIPKRHGLGDEDAADVFQTTFSNLLRTIDRLESGLALPKWLAVTAARESLKIIRIKGRTVSYDTTQMSLDDLVQAEDRDAEGVAVEAERALLLRAGFAELAGRCRDLLNLLYLEENVAYAEVSDRIGMPVGAIGPTRARCLEKLRTVLAKKGFFE